MIDLRYTTIVLAVVLAYVFLNPGAAAVVGAAMLGFLSWTSYSTKNSESDTPTA